MDIEPLIKQFNETFQLSSILEPKITKTESIPLGLGEIGTVSVWGARTIVRGLNESDDYLNIYQLANSFRYKFEDIVRTIKSESKPTAFDKFGLWVFPDPEPGMNFNLEEHRPIAPIFDWNNSYQTDMPKEPMVLHRAEYHFGARVTFFIGYRHVSPISKLTEIIEGLDENKITHSPI